MRRINRLPAAALTAASLLLASCGTSDSGAERAARARECSIYFSIDGYLKESGRGSKPSITQGCPSQYNSIADFSPVPEGHELQGKTANRLYNELLGRGVPEDVAVLVRRSHAFRDWVKLTEAAR